MSNKKRAVDWYKQAQNDLKWAEASLTQGFYSQTCFISQQAGEKAIKAIAYHLEFDVRGHSIAKIAQAIGINSEVEKAGKSLDVYYISARYPDALPAGAPFEFFEIEQATKAIQDATIILQKAYAELELS
jgi:HEPN domain-containing protein